MQVNSIDKWNLLDYENTKKHEQLQRVTDHSALNNDNKSVTVSISQEGLRILHGTKLHGSVDMAKRRELEEIFPKLSYNPADEHLWAVRSKVTDALTALKEQKENYTLDDILSIRLEAYANQYNNLQKAYADGTREVWISDGIDENGEFKFHQVTEEEDFSYLDAGFDRMKREMVSSLAFKENDIKIKEIFYGEHIDINLPNDYQQKMMDILNKTIAEYKEQKNAGENANITKIVQKFFNDDKSFASVMRQLYNI